jgi:phosphate starvation-inducible PhoH-like protein
MTDISKKERDKIKQDVKKELDKIILSDNQKAYSDLIKTNDICLCTGEAGTAKSFISLYTALSIWVKSPIYEQIVLTKPIEEMGENLGFLPGTIEEKTAPYERSFTHNIDKLIGGFNTSVLTRLGILKFEPLAYMRGMTFDRRIMLLDEAQNADYRQIMAFITRMGQDSKVVIFGDASQHDIKSNKVALNKFIEMLEDINGIGTFKFNREDIVRNKILIEITDRYEQWKSCNKFADMK